MTIPAHAQQFGELFAADGPLAATIPGFAVRAEQIAMAQAVADALASRGKSVIEAGTGTGKTFAYLVPALFANKRIIVSSGTKTLQDQLFSRDLPVVASALGMPLRVAILKGRANYLCLQRLETAEREVALSRRRGQLSALRRIREWSFSTRRGDIAELTSLSEADPIWASVTSTRENCLGVECPHFQRCHVVGARREAQAADVVVVNHHLLMADLLLKERGFGDLLPGADAVVIDEAHQLPEVAEQFLGFSVSARQVQNVVRDVATQMQMSRLESPSIAQALQALRGVVADASDALRTERSDIRDWPYAFSDAVAELAAQCKILRAQLDALATEATPMSMLRERVADLVERCEIVLSESRVASIASGVRWAERTEHGFSLNYAPIDVAQQLGALIETHGAAWIFASATLSIAGDFDHFLRRVGIPDAKTQAFGSPFDFERQALLYIPQRIGAPGTSEHTRQVIDAILPILDASGGRAFVLFTSHRALRAAAEILREKWGAQPPFPLLVQGDAPRDRLLHAFREAGNAVLLGTGSFWEGVDVKGSALTVVAIDKLPFAVPDDPVMKARLDEIERCGGNPFFDEQVPQAAIALKQGVGRLIRDTEDFGVVVLCDRRVLTKPYGRIFLESLPNMPRTEDVLVATRFLRAKLLSVGIDTEHARVPDPREEYETARD